MGIKEQLGDNRPYWKVAVSLLFSLSATILFIYLGLKAVFYFMPFVIGWILSVIAPGGGFSGKTPADHEEARLGNYDYSGTGNLYWGDLPDWEQDVERGSDAR